MPKIYYPLIACAGIATATVAMIMGQVGGPYLDPLNLTISEYAALSGGRATQFAMVFLGIASFALVAGLRAVKAPVGVTAERLMLVWSAALIVLAIVPNAAPGQGMELSAQVHRYVSVVAFVALPAAGALMVARFSEDERWRVVARPVEWLALAGGFGLLAMTYVTLPGDGVLIGLVERVLLGTEIALIGVLAVRLAQLTWVRSTSPASRASHAALG
jgi:hypothetical protein